MNLDEPEKCRQHDYHVDNKLCDCIITSNSTFCDSYTIAQGMTGVTESVNKRPWVRILPVHCFCFLDDVDQKDCIMIHLWIANITFIIIIYFYKTPLIRNIQKDCRCTNHIDQVTWITQTFFFIIKCTIMRYRSALWKHKAYVFSSCCKFDWKYIFKSELWTLTIEFKDWMRWCQWMCRVHSLWACRRDMDVQMMMIRIQAIFSERARIFIIRRVAFKLSCKINVTFVLDMKSLQQMLTFCCCLLIRSWDAVRCWCDTVLLCLLYREQCHLLYHTCQSGSKWNGPETHWPHLSGRVKMKQDIFLFFFFWMPKFWDSSRKFLSVESVGVFNWYCRRHLQHRCNCFSYHLNMISAICLFFKQSFNLLLY